ncbi:hypothetical protein [Pseudoduganella sp. HUAS MS19]
MRVLLTVVACLAVHPASAKPATACPPVIGERDMMVGSVVTLGTNKRIGELCKIEAPRVQKMVAKNMMALKPCLQELGVKDVEIKKAMEKGEVAGQEIYSRSGAKVELCARVNEEFDS